MIQLTGAGIVAGAGAGAAGGAAATGDYPNKITFDGTVSNGKSTYEFEVSGGVDPEQGAATQERNDSVTDGRVRGSVHRDADVYHFAGSLTYLDVKGDAGVSIEYGDEGDVAADRLEIVSASEVEYSFTASDRVEKVTGDGDNAAEAYNDSVVENDDGSWTASGYTGNGYGDAYDFWGEPLEFQPVEGEYTLFLNGEEVTLTELTGQEPPQQVEPSVFQIASNADTPAMYYEFAVEGEVIPHDSVEDHDNITQDGDLYRVKGQVGPKGTDSYEVPGKLVEWNAVDANDDYVSESRFDLYWDGEAVGLDDVLIGGKTYVLGVHSTEETPAMYYEFAVEGEVTPHDSVEDHDNITQDGDLYRVKGQVGPKGADSYTVAGKLVEWNAVDTGDHYVPETDFRLTWNGSDTGLEDVLQGEKPTRRLEIYAPENAEIDYTFKTTDTVEPVTDNGDNSAEPNYDAISENHDGSCTVDGLTGNDYGDAFDFKGGVEEFWPQEGEFALYLDDEQVTAWELVGEDEPQTRDIVEGGPVGGGRGYDSLVGRSQADYVVDTKSELGNALSSASSGDIVYVAGNATIDIGGSTFTVPSGVTLASNRGIDDAPGGLIRTDRETKMINVRRGGRVTGLRIQGKYYSYFDPRGDDSYPTGTGVRVTGSDVEVDNCEIWGFAYAGVNASSNTPHIHHNHIHHTPRAGLGYGVVMSGGHPVIEWNYFNYNRHAIAGSGGGGYTARYNHVGPDTIGHIFDMHRPGGDRIHIYRNTVEAVGHVNGGSKEFPAVVIRGVPSDVALIEDNWFYNPNPPRDDPANFTDEAIVQAYVDDWQNMEWSNNHLGSSEPASDIGCPR
ncbi:hypothetical protein HWV07_06405 [Natronomonas salina]|uniref:right-handed parallel beta-helix repeat-containing protein n=1 Tax=Natronomonas salina TaxID=1710540 RepID=UPI0015B6B766|nr:right-handed parallel beta-helix repeat-containing protein [Natronomonas salina]QLD88687.1 hypothetical protein HWV07_06405 [Natronomonas salina]